MNHQYGGPHQPTRSIHIAKTIVSESDARERLDQFLNGRLNKILDHIPLTKIRAELPIDVEKSFKPAKPLSWIVQQIVCLDPHHHFEHDPRDEHIKFVPNGETYKSMPITTDITPPMPRPSSSDRLKGNIPVQQICDAINQKLRDATKGKISMDRAHEVFGQNNIQMDKVDVIEFIKTHIETGDICATFIEKACPLLEYNADGDEEHSGQNTLNNSMKNLSVDKRKDEERRGERREDGVKWRGEEKGRYGEKWKEEDWRNEKRREEEKWREEKRKEEEWRNEKRRGEEEWWENERRGDGGSRSQANYSHDEVEGTEELEERLRMAFPHIHQRHYLIYILQQVMIDNKRETLYADEFSRHLDEMVGGSFDYSQFGLFIFTELIYYHLLEVAESRNGHVLVRLHPLVRNCKVELLKGYMAGEMYRYVRENGRTNLWDLCGWIDNKDSCFLHEQFPKWKEWGDNDKMMDVKAQYKVHYEVFVKDGDYIGINYNFNGVCASPFLTLNHIV
ncbi:hypothetical protein PMAYCL1PPCAC_12118 [Pristionchus mayeri]|uniref:Uncharacterized protein n=1 Tax=Pristionchus mayeri TaxID=1317129 RepID=A0AAN4ZNU8_9BILA|nr:hypothetical protein PMAYCL1PPCAC_12118 [Pristionchus mayeri]